MSVVRVFAPFDGKPQCVRRNGHINDTCHTNVDDVDDIGDRGIIDELCYRGGFHSSRHCRGGKADLITISFLSKI